MKRYQIDFGDSQKFYHRWSRPDIIISDGPYGIKGFDGDLDSPEKLPNFYKEHIESWTRYARPGATLWFWNTEVGWANVHPLLIKAGWVYKGVNTWNKGLGFIAGNSNSKTLSKFPTVTEVCVQYILPPTFKFENELLSEQVWLRKEWQRTGLTLSKTNEASGVKSAATRKYFTSDNLWYSPPKKAFEKLVSYANEFGEKDGRPYFSLDGVSTISGIEWEKMHQKFKLPIGVTNVWDTPQVSGKERLKKSEGNKSLHTNQKPLVLMTRIIEASTDEEDIVWEPFGGLCTGILAAVRMNRIGFSSEINENVYESAIKRLEYEELSFF